MYECMKACMHVPVFTHACTLIYKLQYASIVYLCMRACMRIYTYYVYTCICVYVCVCRCVCVCVFI